MGSTLRTEVSPAPCSPYVHHTYPHTYVALDLRYHQPPTAPYDYLPGHFSYPKPET